MAQRQRAGLITPRSLDRNGLSVSTKGTYGSPWTPPSKGTKVQGALWNNCLPSGGSYTWSNLWLLIDSALVKCSPLQPIHQNLSNNQDHLLYHLVYQHQYFLLLLGFLYSLEYSEAIHSLYLNPQLHSMYLNLL